MQTSSPRRVRALRVGLAEQAVLREALARGWIGGQQARAALLAREALRMWRGEPPGLVALLRAQGVTPEVGLALARAFDLAMRAQGDAAAPGELEEPVDPALGSDVHAALEAGRAGLASPPERDPAPVRQLLDATRRRPAAPASGALDAGAAGSWAAAPRPPSARRFGDYEVVRELGRGGIGAVYEVRRPPLEQRLALKVLHTVDDADEVARFEAEARALMRLSHPGIVAIRDVGRERGVPFLVMDLVEGESLLARLRRAGPLPEHEAARLGAAVARALAHAHARGLLHRDLKPANVLVTPSGEPVVADLGMALDRASSRRLTATGEALGTPAYMAPEQARGDRAALGPAVDVYGLGATLYHALVGAPPFDGTNAMKVLADVVTSAPPRPSLARPALDPELEAIVLRCMEREPRARYPDVAAVAEVLEGWSAARRSPSGRGAGRHPSVVVVVVVVLVALAALAVALAVARRPDDDVAPAPPVVAPTEAAPARDPATRVREARARLAHGDVDAARAELEALTRADPAVLDAWLALHELDARDAPALAPTVTAPLSRLLEEARARAAQDAPPALVARAIEALARDGAAAPGQAEGLAGRAVVARPDLRVAWLTRGVARLRQRDAAGAEADAHEVLALDGGDRRALVLRGVARANLRRFEDALADLDRAVALRQDPEALCARAEVRQGLEHLEAAARDVDAAIALAPDDAGIHVTRGALRAKLGRLREAVDDMRRATLLAPDSAIAWNGLAGLLQGMGDVAGAHAALDRAIQLEPREADHLINRAQLLSSSGDVAAALVDLARAAELAPTKPMPHLQRARLLLNLRRLDEALAAADQAVEVAPDHPDARFLRGTLRFTARDLRGALDDLDRAVALAPHDADIVAFRANVRFNAGDRQGALDDLTSAIERAPRRHDLLVGRAELRLRLGQREAAVADLERFLRLAPADHPLMSAARQLLERSR